MRSNDHEKICEKHRRLLILPPTTTFSRSTWATSHQFLTKHHYELSRYLFTVLLDSCEIPTQWLFLFSLLFSSCLFSFKLLLLLFLLLKYSDEFCSFLCVVYLSSLWCQKNPSTKLFSLKFINTSFDVFQWHSFQLSISLRISLFSSRFF